MLAIPEVDNLTVTFGVTGAQLRQLPKYEDIPLEFRRNNLWSDAASYWFFEGAQKFGEGITIKGRHFTAKPGIDFNKALRAVKGVLGSFEPAHEHKMALCGLMLHDWFDTDAPPAPPKKSPFELQLDRDRAIRESVRRDQDAADLRARKIASGELVLPEKNRPYELWQADKKGRFKTYRSREALETGFTTHDGERTGLVRAFCKHEGHRDWL